jgi:hypothetical protein
MNNRIYVIILNLATPLFLSGFCSLSLALETMPNLDMSFHIENSVKSLKRKGASAYAQAGLALVTAEDMQERIDTMLQIRHTVDRTVSHAEYVTFVCHAVQTSARATMHEIITILDTIASSITYWQQQQGHQMSYLFHKNPAKWVTGKAQSAEIRQHLDALYALQKTYFSHLGTIAQQVQAISPVCATADDQQPIMQRIAHAMSGVVGVSNSSDDITVSADLLIDDTVKALYQVPLYIKRAHREIKPHTVPLWVTRNWLSTGAVLAGSALSIYWYIQTKQRAHGWIDAQQAKLKPELYKAAGASLRLADKVDQKLVAGMQHVDAGEIKATELADTLTARMTQAAGYVDMVRQQSVELADTITTRMERVAGYVDVAGAKSIEVADLIEDKTQKITDLVNAKAPVIKKGLADARTKIDAVKADGAATYVGGAKLKVANAAAETVKIGLGMLVDEHVSDPVVAGIDTHVVPMVTDLNAQVGEKATMVKTKVPEYQKIFTDLNTNIGKTTTFVKTKAPVYQKIVEDTIETIQVGATYITNKLPEYTQHVSNTAQYIQAKIGHFNKAVPHYVPTIADGIDTTSRISKNVVTFGLPLAALATAYCGYKLTKSICATVYPLLFPTPNYQYVRQSLNDMSHIFNNNQHAATLSVDNLGALVYHVHTLQKSAVPGELRDQFNADVTELASAGYTREQKIRTIDRMYRSYDFLAAAS